MRVVERGNYRERVYVMGPGVPMVTVYFDELGLRQTVKRYFRRSSDDGGRALWTTYSGERLWHGWAKRAEELYEQYVAQQLMADELLAPQRARWVGLAINLWWQWWEKVRKVGRLLDWL